MILTVLEATVPEEKWAALRAAWADRAPLRPPQLLQSFLTQGAANRELWRIITLWPDRAALDQMRRLEPVPGGVLIFRTAGVEPVLALFEVPGHLPPVD